MIHVLCASNRNTYQRRGAEATVCASIQSRAKYFMPMGRQPLRIHFRKYYAADSTGNQRRLKPRHRLPRRAIIATEGSGTPDTFKDQLFKVIVSPEATSAM